jgi:guanylate kinase
VTGKLIVISGPSGCGKGTVIKKLSEMIPFKLSVSDTTRPPRTGEVDTVDYNFLSNEEFLRKVENGEYFEHAEYNGSSKNYGTPNTQVLPFLEAGETVILEIDVQGAEQIKAKTPEAVLIFILPPSKEILKERLSGRGTESQEIINKRLQTAEAEINKASNFDYRVINDSLDECASQIRDIIENINT